MFAFDWQGIRLAPSGFFETIATDRSVAAGGNVSTKFGSVPLTGSDGEWLVSPRHSRMMLDGDRDMWGGKITGYVEADFMTAGPANPLRFRQYYGMYTRGKWEISAGQEWSLLRPNRTGITSRSELMNTVVADPAYHTGLAGVRDRQVRVVRHEGNWHFAASFENGKDFLSKIAHDGKRLHWELIAVGGKEGHHGASVAYAWKAHRRLTLVGQHFMARGGGKDALGTAPAYVLAKSNIVGAEMIGPLGFQLHGYSGFVQADRSPGNRMVRQSTAGVSRTLTKDTLGTATMNFQYSRLNRSVWSGQHGDMNLLMVSLRHTFASPRGR
jgi:hypothetical protein